MALNKKLTGSLISLVLAISSPPFFPTSTALASSEQLAQVTPNTVTGRLDRSSQVHWDGSYYNIHTFEGQAGETVRIDMVSDDFDAYLILFDPQGGRITQNDDGGIGSNATIIATLPATGNYQIAANAYRAGETGQYTVTWRPATSQELNSSPPASIADIITEAILGQSTESPEDALAEALLEEVLSQQPIAGANSNSPSNTNQDSDALQRASILNQQAIALYQAGRYDEAAPLMEESVAIWRAEVGDRGPGMSNGLSGLALIYRTQGRFEESVSLYQEALSIDRESLGERHPDVAQNLSNLAAVYESQGRYGEAAASYQESLDIWRELPRIDLRIADSLQALAGIYVLQGRYSDLEPLVQEALSIYQQQNRPLGIANSLSNLGIIYYRRGQYADAENFLREAIEIKRQRLSNRHSSVGDSLNNLGTIYRAQQKYEQAEAALKEALSIRKESESSQYAVAQTLNNLASLYYEQKRFEAAESLLTEALAIRREFSSITGETYVVDDPLIELAKLYTAQENIDQAIGRLQEALNIQERYLNLNLATTADAQRQTYAATLSETTDQAISLSIETAPESRPAARLALTTILRRKGRILDASTNDFQAVRQKLTAADQTILDELVEVRQQLAALTFNRPQNLPPEQYQVILNELQARDNELASTLARRNALFAAESTPAEISPVQARLPDDSMLLEYVRYSPFDADANQWKQPRYAAYLLFSDGRIEVIDLGDATEIDTAVQSFVGLLQNRSADFQRAGARPTARQEDIEQVTSDIKELVFDPIAPYLQDTDHLLISPDGQLNLLPFEALQTEAGGEYLVQQYQISYLNSGRDLLKFDVVKPSQNRAVIVANPDYEEADATVVAQGRSTSDNRRSTELSQFQVGPLPGTAAEAEAIRPLLPNAEIRTEDEATENLLKSVQAPHILHIATHGFFLTNVDRPDIDSSGLLASNSPFGTVPTTGVVVENPLLRSGLALAGFNTRSSGSEDGVFTALEASQLNLFGTQLVVLSACDTGLGDISNGEGVYGLRRAFALAGAETQLLSLWQVDDFGTQSLMASYYENLTAGMGRSEALREVQLEMIEQGGDYSHPYYWAAFVLTGDWRPLE